LAFGLHNLVVGKSAIPIRRSIDESTTGRIVKRRTIDFSDLEYIPQIADEKQRKQDAQSRKIRNSATIEIGDMA